MHNHRQAEAREAVRLLSMLSIMYVPEAYLNEDCFGTSP